MLSFYAECWYDERRCAKCHYVNSHYAVIVLSVVMLSFYELSFFILIAVMLNFFILGAVMLSLFMLRAAMLCPLTLSFCTYYHHYYNCCLKLNVVALSDIWLSAMAPYLLLYFNQNDWKPSRKPEAVDSHVQIDLSFSSLPCIGRSIVHSLFIYLDIVYVSFFSLSLFLSLFQSFLSFYLSTYFSLFFNTSVTLLISLPLFLSLSHTHTRTQTHCI